jgi:hypothetical protein
MTHWLKCPALGVDLDALSDSDKLMRILAHGQHLALLEKAATESSGVPAAASGGVMGSGGGDLSIDEGGGPARVGARHLDSNTGLGDGAGHQGGSSGGGGRYG